MSTELICFFLLGIAALLLNDGFDAQALPLFWLIIPLIIKIILNNLKRKSILIINKNEKRG